MPARITIAGDIGSGKTTIARRLADTVGVEPLSTGGIQRNLAQGRGVSVLELNRLAETDESIDREIDSYLMNLPSGDLVVESRMAWHFVPDTTKVYLYIADHEAARRLVGARRSDEDYSAIADPIGQILARRRSELHRFSKYYQVDIDELRNYDVVIDTTFADADLITKMVGAHAPSDQTPVCWLDPRNLVPTRRADDPPDAAALVTTLYVDHVFYIADGHAQVAAALRRVQPFVPAVIAASNDEVFGRESARRTVETAVHDALVHDWEKATGFQFQHPIWKGRGGTSRRGVGPTEA